MSGRTLTTVACAAILAFAAPAQSQSPTSAMLSGRVTTAAGVPLNDARVAIEDAAGTTRAVRTDRDGRYLFRFVEPGDYAVFAEQLGYQPQRIIGVPLRSGRSLDVDLALQPVEPPVHEVDERAFRGGAGYSRAGVSRWLGALESDAAPLDRFELPYLAGLASQAGWDAGAEGLPPHYTRLLFDGASYEPLLHPHLAGEEPLSPRPLSGMAAAELFGNPLDVEWDGAAGGFLSTYGRRGGSEYRVRAWGSGSADELGTGFFSPRIGGRTDLFRAGAEVSGPLIADTAHFAIGGEWRRVRTIQPRAWDVGELAGAMATRIAADSAGVDLSGYAVADAAEVDVASGYARFDWLVAEGHELTARADIAAAPAADDQLLSLEPAPGPAPDAMAVAAGVSLRSALGERFGNELRVSFDRSNRDYLLPGGAELRGFLSDGVAQTGVVDGALLFGVDPAAPATFERTSARAQQALSALFGGHLLKLGVDVGWESHDRTYAYNRTGRFLFGGVDGFESRRGAFVQTVGSIPAADFSTLEIGVFLQDTWRPAPGLELLAGVRLSEERLPFEDVSPDAGWLELTGLGDEELDERVRQWSPRLGFTWDVRDRHRWLVHAGFGMYGDDIAPDILAELLTHDGGVRVRRGVGDLGRWPQAPDSAAAPPQGPALALLGPEFRPPRSTRASFGISRLGGTSLHLSASYRHTDFLPSRRDLNLLPSATATDQYGRALYGELTKQGALLATRPGTNRRFPGYDVVSSLEATSYSDYWGVTALVERRVGGVLDLAASYTYSRTEDDWLARPGLAPVDALAPLFGDAESQDGWAEGVSDYDVPHRLSLVGALALPLPLRPTLSAVYRFHSGLPFTPGFRDGVDANGDYSWSNDPAFVDDSLEGMDALMEEWDCLRDQAGGFAERNVCRAESVQTLDLRLAVDVVRRGDLTLRLMGEALDLLENEWARPDRALYLIDPAGDLVADAQAGTVTIPLVVNPNFGQPIRPLGSDRVYRIGAEVIF